MQILKDKYRQNLEMIQDLKEFVQIMHSEVYNKTCDLFVFPLVLEGLSPNMP